MPVNIKNIGVWSDNPDKSRLSNVAWLLFIILVILILFLLFLPPSVRASFLV